ncbi:MAG: ParA family protein, partial [Phycisphaeraceae bacterium]|nr:ParA family protein [Phycisphaeraceae bacterium]
MRTVAFYSYKGGTGRTLALANIAVFAARVGKRVVAIDMDLEAPGLTYKLLDKPITPIPSRGLVGYLLDSFDLGEPPMNLHDYLLDVDAGDGPTDTP